MWNLKFTKAFSFAQILNHFKVPFYINKKNLTKSIKLSTKVCDFRYDLTEIKNIKLPLLQ